MSDKNFSKKEVKALNKLVKNKNEDEVIQKTDRGNKIVILNWSDFISKLKKISLDNPKFKRVILKKGKLWIIWFKWKNELYVYTKV